MKSEDKNNLKVALVGCGNIAKVHFRLITKYIDKHNIALCDKDKIRLEDFAIKTGIKNIYSDLETLLGEFCPNVAHILTPPATHKDIAIKFLKNNCHVLIEKPMCISVEEADEIIKIAKEKELLACTDYMRLFDPMVLEAKKLLNSEKLGKIVNISAGYSYDLLKRINIDPAARWLNSLPGGAFFDVIPHPLCILEEFLPGLEIGKSTYLKNKEGLITDLLCFFISPSGTGILHMSLNIYPLKNYVIFECTDGVLTVDFRNFLFITRKSYGLPNAVERIAENLSVGIQTLKQTIGSVFSFLLGKLDSYSGLDFIIQRFYKAIGCNAESPVSPEKAKILLRLTEAIFSNEKKGESREYDTQTRLPGNAEVLVTGGTGFIGRKLVAKLIERGCKVRILTHRSLWDEELRSFFSHGVDVMHADIYNYEDVEKACKGINTVYHLAAAMRGDWNYHLDTTITGTKNILEAATKMGVRHLIYVSTLNVYNAKEYPQNGIINEDFPYENMPEKRGAYSHAKLRAEKMVREYFERDKLSICLVRPGLVYGHDGKAFLRDVGLRLGKKLVIVLGNGWRKLPLVYVDNLVEALLITGENEKTKGIFNIVDSEYPTQREFIKNYRRLSNEKFITVYIPMWLLYLGFGIIESMVFFIFKKSPSLRYKLQCIYKNAKHSTERIEGMLGWKPRVLFEEGLKLSIQEASKKTS